MDPADQPALEAAARLQDVGYLINYDQHHKHSYHLILNSRLPGFRPRELELVANVARYHRGAPPKQKHDNFRSLPRDDQQRVRQLAAILRDRRRPRSQPHPAGERRHVAIRAATATTIGQQGLELLAHAAENPEVDLWALAAARKCSPKSLTASWKCIGRRKRRPTAGRGTKSPHRATRATRSSYAAITLARQLTSDWSA